MTKEMIPTRSGTQQGSFMMHPFLSLHQDVDRLFDRYIPSGLANWFAEGETVNPYALMDVAETDKAFDIRLDVPGVEEDDIDVTLSDNVLTIRGKREASSEERKEDFFCVERSYGKFVRRVDLPSEVDIDKIDASIKNGVLALHMDKSKKAKSKERKIKIHT